MVEITYEVDPGGKFKEAIKDASKKVDDLTLPFISITKSWYQGNKSIFNLKSPGKYTDYKRNKDGFSRYADLKDRRLGSPYPMLRGFTGKLEKSLTEAGNEGTINQVVNKKILILGTSVPYAPYLQFGTKFMVPRPFMFIGPEQTSPSDLNRRAETWVLIIQDYVKQSTQRVGKTK